MSNAEIDARHKNEPETEFCYGMNPEEALRLYEVIGETETGDELQGLFEDLSGWLTENGYQ